MFKAEIYDIESIEKCKPFVFNVYMV